jgi:carbamoyl-phosphate synthase small subunit
MQNLFAARPRAVLALTDGQVFKGISVGAAGLRPGEVVFNTALTGYQEILTDPSYCQQLVMLTYPHIGNVGCNDDDAESAQVYAAGLIVRDVPERASNWRKQQDLPEYLQTREVQAISEVDTRALTIHLRTHGAQNGAIAAAADALESYESLSAKALAAARAFPGLSGADLAKVVSTKQSYQHPSGTYDLLGAHYRAAPAPQFHVVAYDFGVKRNILNLLTQAGCKVTVVPAQTDAQSVFALQPDGVFLSNGPGDPAPCDYAIQAIQAFLAAKLPVFGICLGHQLLGLAAGAKTKKMKFGHHGANHPVQDLRDKRVFISSQNHGFAIDEDALPAHISVTHRSLFDGSNQGIALNNAPAFSFQGHPEASPGPRDLEGLFAEFTALMRAHANS